MLVLHCCLTKKPLLYAFSTTFLMTFHMVIYTGSSAGDLWITVELWVNEAFVPLWAVMKCLIKVALHSCVHIAHTHIHTHVHRGGKHRKIHQSLSHAEGGSLKEAVSFLSLMVLLSLSSISLSVTSLLSPDTTFSVSPSGHHHAAWLSLGCLPVFSRPAGWRDRLLPGQPDGRV